MLKFALLFAVAGPVALADHGEINLTEAKGQGQCDVRGSLSNGRLNIDLWNFHAELDRASQVRKVCNIAVNLAWPKGHRIVFKDLRAKGHSTLARGAKGRLSAELFTAGDRGEVLEVSREGVDGSYREVLAGEVNKSDCGGSGMLRLNTSLTIRGQRAQGSFMNADQLTARVKLERCDD